MLRSFLLVLLACSAVGEPVAWFQAHRGGMDEVPENTLAAFRHAWSIPGAVPEVDIRTTADGVLIALHDETLDRTVAVPAALRGKPVATLDYAAIAGLDAGRHFDPEFAGETVPKLEAVFALMCAAPERQLYLDVKDAETGTLLAMIDRFEARARVIFVHGSPRQCLAYSKLYPGARTMTWCSGTPRTITRRFTRLAEAGFPGIGQIQLHLPAASSEDGSVRYAIDAAFLEAAVTQARAAGAVLQVRPMLFSPESLRALLALGIRWYVADAPEAFAGALRTAAAAAAGSASSTENRL